MRGKSALKHPAFRIVVAVIITAAVVAPSTWFLKPPEKEAEIIVGTSADYPPFENVVDGEYVGFDIDLIRAIGVVEGFEIEIKDMAFESLVPATKAGRLDVVAAATFITPKREKVVDYSLPYQKGGISVLKKKGTDVTVTTWEDIANYKVGTQIGTSEERYIKEDFIETGLMPEENLKVYDRFITCVEDLKTGRLELVMLDVLPAYDFAKKYPKIEIAYTEEEKHIKEIALMVRQGDAETKNMLDDGLRKLYKIGELQRIYRKWDIPFIKLDWMK